MKLSTLAIHAAQVDRIEALTSYTIYDGTPQDVVFPYVAMGEITAKRWCDKLEDGTEVYSTIHIWSQYDGRKEADEMADAISQALSSSPISVAPSFLLALGKLDGYSLIVDMDGETRHGVLRMRYLVEEL